MPQKDARLRFYMKFQMCPKSNPKDPIQLKLILQKLKRARNGRKQSIQGKIDANPFIRS